MIRLIVGSSWVGDHTHDGYWQQGEVTRLYGKPAKTPSGTEEWVDFSGPRGHFSQKRDYVTLEAHPARPTEFIFCVEGPQLPRTERALSWLGVNADDGSPPALIVDELGETFVRKGKYASRGNRWMYHHVPEHDMLHIGTGADKELKPK